MYTIHGIDQVEDVNTLLSTSGGYKAFLKLRDEGVVKNICFSYHKWNEASQKCFSSLMSMLLCASLMLQGLTEMRTI